MSTASAKTPDGASDMALWKYLNGHRRKLCSLGIYVKERRFGDWHAVVMTKDELLERLDGRARDAANPDRRVAADIAAWVRGQMECVEIIEDATGVVCRGTVTYDRGDAHGRVYVN